MLLSGVMNILAFDTCFDACSVAVGRTGSGAVAAERLLMRRGHAEALVPLIERTMQSAGLGFEALDRIAVTHGPGTFTGVRIGIAAALGLAFAHGTAVVTYSSLNCIARAAIEALGNEFDADGVAVVRDAKRGSVYIEIADMAGNEVAPPALLAIEEACELVRAKRYVVVGRGRALLAGALIDIDAVLSARAIEGIEQPDARHMLADAATRQPISAPAPLYLRPPDATPSSVPPLARAAAGGDGHVRRS